MDIYKKEITEEYERLRGVLHTLEVLGERTTLIEIYNNQIDILGKVIRACDGKEQERANEKCNLASIKGSGFKDEMSRAFAAGRVMQRCNKLTYWDDDEMKDVEYSGFNAWFKRHYL